MNLKESFRYQKFLDSMMSNASASIQSREHSMKLTKTHLRNKANPEAEDKVEEVDYGVFFANDDVLAFMQFLVGEKNALTCAIGKAKASCGLDIDAAVETNKYRQTVHNATRRMLGYVAANRVERGTDYKFNVEGNQVQYTYDVEVEFAENYNRESARQLMRTMISESDDVSRSIDTAMINTVVDYDAPFDVNDSFDDAMAAFLANRGSGR